VDSRDGRRGGAIHWMRETSDGEPPMAEHDEAVIGGRQDARKF
jgi:hypothetical protein